MSRLLTLNIGASKAMLAEYNLAGKNSLSLTAYGSADLPQIDADLPGAMEAALTPVIHGIMREKGIKSAPVALSLSGQMVFPRFAKFPNIGDKAKLDQLVRYEVEQNVPFPIDEIVSDYQFLGETADGDQAAMIIAAKLDQVRGVTDAISAAGLKPYVVDAAPMAIYNTLKFAYPNLDGCNVVLDIGSKTTNLILIENEKIYNRSIPVAGNMITKEIAQTFGCSYEEAEQLKRDVGYVSMGGVTEDADEVADRVSKVIRTVLTRLHAEISRSINFYRSQQGGNAPSRLFLTGGTSQLAQLDEFFQDSLQVEVLYLNPFGGKIAIGSKIDKAAIDVDFLSLAESVGLALRMTDAAQVQLNLMPPEIIEQARAIKRVPFFAVGAVSVLVALGLGIVVNNHKRSIAEAKLAEVEQRNSALNALDGRLKKEQKAAESALEKSDLFQALLRERSEALLRVRAVRESLIPGMWITEWAPIAGKGDAAKVEGVRITVRGWRDRMQKIEADWAKKNNNKKSTAAEIVAQALRGRQVIVSDSVKIDSQKDVQDCISEFVIKMNFAPSPTLVANKSNTKKGARR